MTLDLRDGPELIFGDRRARCARSGCAAARVLAELLAPGATYLDLRVPEAWSPRAASGRSHPSRTPAPTVVPSNPQP